MSINQILYKKWAGINFNNTPNCSSHKTKNKQKNNGNSDASCFSGEKKPLFEDHHVWPKSHRNGSDIRRRYKTKDVIPEEHDVWHKYAKNLHPQIAFIYIIKLCTGKVKATEDEVRDLELLAGFNWRKNPNKAIVEIFEKFMPDELGEMLKPYL